MDMPINSYGEEITVRIEVMVCFELTPNNEIGNGQEINDME